MITLIIIITFLRYSLKDKEESIISWMDGNNTWCVIGIILISGIITVTLISVLLILTLTYLP